MDYPPTYDQIMVKPPKEKESNIPIKTAAAATPEAAAGNNIHIAQLLEMMATQNKAIKAQGEQIENLMKMAATKENTVSTLPPIDLPWVPKPTRGKVEDKIILHDLVGCYTYPPTQQETWEDFS